MTITDESCLAETLAFVPGHVDGVYLHLHGGGWAFGQDERLWRLAVRTRPAVVSVAPDGC